MAARQPRGERREVVTDTPETEAAVHVFIHEREGIYIEYVKPVVAAGLERRLTVCRDRIQVLEQALLCLLELGRQNTEHPKYDGYYDAARRALGK